MKRSGFTMIELIFVIVILGILASVAIPKLAATREDAKISKIDQNVATLVADAAAFYTSQGLANWKNNKTVADVTNVPLSTSATAMADASTSKIAPNTGSTDFYINADKDHNCLKVTTTPDGNMTIAKGTDTSGTVCAQVQKDVASMIKTHSFGGVSIVR